jgi:hypothetical protein
VEANDNASQTHNVEAAKLAQGRADWSDMTNRARGNVAHAGASEKKKGRATVGWTEEALVLSSTAGERVELPDPATLEQQRGGA